MRKTDEAWALEHDVHRALVRLIRRGSLKSFREDLVVADLQHDAQLLAAELHMAIGGRYVPSARAAAAARAARYAAIYDMWDGRNREQVMRHFNISRRWFYSVISQETKRRQKGVA